MMEQSKPLRQSDEMRARNAQRLSHRGAAMYLDRRVRFSKANEVADKARQGAGWESRD